MLGGAVHPAGRLRRARTSRPRSAAESITSTDNKTWTIKLKDGYTFHNGEKVTADSYINAWNYGAYGPNGQDNSYFFEKIAGYDDTAVDRPGRRRPAEGAGAEGEDADRAEEGRRPDLHRHAVGAVQRVQDDARATPRSTRCRKAAFSSPGVIKDGFEDATDRQRPLQDEGHLAARRQDRGRAVRRLPGRRSRRSAASTFRIYQQPTAAYADLHLGQPRRRADDPDREPDQRAERPRRPVPAEPGVDVPVPGVPDLRPGLHQARGPQGDLDGDRPRRDHQVGLQGLAAVGHARSSRRSSPVTGTTPVARPASSTRPRPRRPTRRPAARRSIKISYNADGGHKDWVDATCNQLKTNLGVDCVGTAEPKFADLLQQGRGQAAGRHVPAGLGHGLPVHGELPRPAVLDQRFVELLRLQQPAVRHAGQGGLGRGHPGRGDQEVPAGRGHPRARTCR